MVPPLSRENAELVKGMNPVSTIRKLHASIASNGHGEALCHYQVRTIRGDKENGHNMMEVKEYMHVPAHSHSLSSYIIIPHSYTLPWGSHCCTCIAVD